MVRVIEFDQSSGQDRTDLLSISVAWERTEVLLNSHQCKSPGPRTGKANHDRKRDLKEMPGCTSERLIFGAPQYRPQCPQRASMTILGSVRFAPHAGIG